MCDTEFSVPSRLENLFSSSSKYYTVKEEFSKQTITVEILQLKRSMYADIEGFIFNHFDLYCNLLRQFSELDEGLKVSAFQILLQVTEKVISLLTNVLNEDTEEFEKEISFKYRNMIMMTVYLLCQFTHAFEDAVLKKTANINAGKGRKKKVNIEETELSEWPEKRLKFLVVLKKIFQLPIRKFWSPPIIDYEFINYVTNSFFKLLENVEIAKDKGMKAEIFRFLGSVFAENRTGIGYSIKILQMVQDFEHLPNIMADAVVHFMQENSADTLAADICREAILLDVKSLVTNLTGAHSLSQFLISICEKCPEKVLCVIGNLLQFLEMESHVMRNCVLSIMGVILNKVLANENISPKEKKLREELLSQLEAHLLDVNSFVRCKAIQVFKTLMDEKALTSAELYRVGKLISNRIKDKASNVRKNAMSFMALFIDVNQFACQIPLEILKESFETENQKLKQLEKSRPLVFDDSDDEETEDGKVAKNGVVFDDSDEEEDGEGKENEEKEVSGDKPESEKDKDESDMQVEQNELNEDKPETADDVNEEEFVKQKAIVDYLKNTLNFAEVIHGIVEPVCALLHSSTQTDVLEAIEFLTAAAGNLVTGSNVGIKEILNLVWSTEVTVKEAALNAFKSLYLSSVKDKRDVADIAKNLIDLLKNATVDDAVNLRAFVIHFSELNEIPDSISNVLWTNLINPASGVTEQEKIAILMLLGMIAEQRPDFVWSNLNSFVKYGLGADGEKNFQLAMYTLMVLRKANVKNRGKFQSAHTIDEETRLPSDHVLAERIKCLLIEGIKNYEDNQWTPMANEAVLTIFSLMKEPEVLCMKIMKEIIKFTCEELESEDGEKEATFETPNILWPRFMSLCGHIALHYMTYMKIDYFALLRRQEIFREQRRRQSTVNRTFSTPKYPSVTNTPKSKTKKRQSINKNYKLIPPVDEETTYEQVLEICAKEVKDETKLIGSLLPIVKATCLSSLKEYNKEIQAAASLALTKFMLFSERVCEENMQLFATITEKSPEAYIRANMLIAMGDLATNYPNVVEPWTSHIYQRLSDPEPSVRETAIITLTHLILHDFVRVKSLVSEAAKCIADEQKSVADVAMYLFSELSKKGNIIYNIIPDIISTLSDPKAGISEEKFQVVLRHMLQYVEKEKLVEGLVEKLCVRFTGLSTDVQMHELTFCLSILTLNDKCYSMLMELKNLLKERMSDPVIMKYITDITANAKKNDAKTAAELDMFRKELGI